MEEVSEFRNNLLNRKEVVVGIESNGNPGFALAGKKLAEKFKVNEDQIAVKAVKGNFGANHFLVEGFIYDSLAHKEKIEPRKKEKKAK